MLYFMKPLNKKDVEKQFSLVDLRFDTLENKVDDLEKRFDILESRFDDLEKRFDALEFRFDRLEKRFDDLERKFDQAFTNLDNFMHMYKNQDEQIAMLTSLCDRLGVKDQELDTRVSLLEKQVRAE